MAKRSADDDDTSPHSKRQRLTDNRPDNDRSSKADVDKITSAKHLRGLLAFKQEAGPDTKRSLISLWS